MCAQKIVHKIKKQQRPSSSMYYVVSNDLDLNIFSL